MSSANYIPSSVPLPLPEEKLLELIKKGRDWAVMHGAAMRPKVNFSEDGLNFAPFVLFPLSMTRKDYQHALDLQTIFQEVIHKVANNDEFLRKSLEKTILVDDFTAKLWEIYEKVHAEGETQPLSLGLIRCDYMLQTSESNSKIKLNNIEYPECTWKLVEFNTIAAGFGWLGPASGLLQRYILEEMDLHDHLHRLPENNALSGICQGIITAWEMYNDPNASILIVVEDVTINICDQRFHQFKLREMMPNVNVMRKTLTQIQQEGTLNKNKELVIDNQVISVVYYRSGYEPSQYYGENEWAARLLVERSRAIKCPTIKYHLAGCKKIQQELGKPGVIEKFLSNPDSIKMFKDAYVDIYGLDFGECGDKAIKLGINNPEKFVLKPQREGGGHNIYGAEIKDALIKLKNSEERAAWILMERIFPPISKGYSVRPGEKLPPPISELVSEFGIFGAIIGDSKQIISNLQVGHMLRTKISTANEGGVHTGLGALDSPYLID